MLFQSRSCRTRSQFWRKYYQYIFVFIYRSHNRLFENLKCYADSNISITRRALSLVLKRQKGLFAGVKSDKYIAAAFPCYELECFNV
jgi:hypothetical protein